MPRAGQATRTKRRMRRRRASSVRSNSRKRLELMPTHLRLRLGLRSLQARKSELGGHRRIGREQVLDQRAAVVELLFEHLRAIARSQAEQFPHQSAARMRDQVHLGPSWQRARELQRVVHRRARHRAVFPREGARAVACMQLAPRLASGRGRPQSAEAAVHARGGAVHEDQDRSVLCRQRAALHRSEAQRVRIERHPEQAFTPAELSHLALVAERRRRLALQVDAEEFQQANAHAHQAALAARHGGPGDHPGLLRAGLARDFAPAIVERQIVRTQPQHEVVVEADPHEIVRGELAFLLGGAGRVTRHCARTEHGPRFEPQTAGHRGIDAILERSADAHGLRATRFGLASPPRSRGHQRLRRTRARRARWNDSRNGNERCDMDALPRTGSRGRERPDVHRRGLDRL